ncbi:MAG: hypothetical protein Q8Q90_01020 [bacterium]|nr:hypothetical protein [bacterium]
MKKDVRSKITRNKFTALNHVLNTECIPALEALCRLVGKEEKISVEMKTDRRAAGRGYGDIPILKRALLCLLCVRITNIFDDKRGISFRDFKVKLQKDKIVKDMITTRHTWFGHIGRENNNIVSAKEICNSNLKKRLEGASSCLMEIYFKID